MLIRQQAASGRARSGIKPDVDWSWSWKDVEPFEAAISRGIFDTETKNAVEMQAAEVQREIADRSGPFDAAWQDWAPPVAWPAPSLPPDFAAGVPTPPGATVTLSPDRF